MWLIITQTVLKQFKETFIVEFLNLMQFLSLFISFLEFPDFYSKNTKYYHKTFLKFFLMVLIV